MRFLCLGYYSPEAFDRMSDEERQALQLPAVRAHLLLG